MPRLLSGAGAVCESSVRNFGSIAGWRQPIAAASTTAPLTAPVICKWAALIAGNDLASGTRTLGRGRHALCRLVLIAIPLRHALSKNVPKPYRWAVNCSDLIDFASATSASAAIAVNCGIIADQGFSKPRKGVDPSIEALM